MKKIIKLISITFLISCQQEMKEIEAIKRIGYNVSDETSKKLDLFGGPESAKKFGKIILKPIMKGIWRQ